MAVETYSWRSQLGACAIEYSQAVRAAQFGDGYEQVADNGINSTAIQVPMKHTGNESEVDRIRDFLLPYRESFHHYAARRREGALPRRSRFGS
ncbi:phage tail protein [Enterobacter hormaechei]